MISRRVFLAAPLLSSLRPFASLGRTGRRFAYDHVLGTSLDVVVWSATEAQARDVSRIVLDEIDRLASILDTRNPSSEIARLGRTAGASSPDLAALLDLYAHWQTRTGGVLSIRPAGAHAPVDVDALGKAFILDRAAAAVRHRSPGVEGLLLDAGGDIVTWGRDCEIGVSDPANPYDNVAPLTRVRIRDAAVATSGSSARGAHLLDARTGLPPRVTAATTVVAPDLVTANALATSVSVMEADAGLQLVERTPGTGALRLADGVERRSSGFARFERAPVRQSASAALSSWPDGYQVTMSFALPNLGRRALRPFLAVWAEDEAGTLVRIITLWGTKTDWQPELTTLWSMTDGRRDLLAPVTRPTRSAGRYQIVWSGTDLDGQPVPQGTYRIVVEASRERGDYTRRGVLLTCGSDPASASLDNTTNWEGLSLQFGPRPART